MTIVHFYFRHPRNDYFSIEKLFHKVAEQVNNMNPQKFKVSNLNLPLPTALANLWRNITYARKTQAAINHITGDVHYVILGLSSRNINILTVHDSVMLRRIKRTNLKFWIIKWFWYDLPVRKADMVTVISENSKRELMFFTGCPENKIRVIGNFPDTRYRTTAYNFKKELPLVLFISTTENKNLVRLISAMKDIPARLHIIGNLSENQKEDLSQHSISYQISSGLTDEEMRQAYVDCDLLAFPSTYEGFGLPIVEAQLTGRPVLTSNLSPMKEVAGEGAMLVDPHDVGSIREGLLKIIHNDAFRERIVKAGFENVKRFNLDAVAKQYTSLYEELIAKKSIHNS
jgi:glycosyltransferase involved in cell wall biosynthesis